MATAAKTMTKRQLTDHLAEKLKTPKATAGIFLRSTN